MTLIFSKTKHPDIRMVEQEQKIVRLGLENIQIENQIESKKRELKNLNTSCDLVRVVFLRIFEKLNDEEKKEVEDKTKTLFNFDAQMAAGKKALENLELKQRGILDKITEEEKKFSGLSSSNWEAEEKKKQINEDIQKLAVLRLQRHEEATTATRDAQNARRILEKENAELAVVRKNKILLDSSLDKSRKELEELNEIISILQTTNKQGLDLVASFEGERQRLMKKDEMLENFKHDLIIYAKRLQTEREKAGIKTPMTLPITLD